MDLVQSTMLGRITLVVCALGAPALAEVHPNERYQFGIALEMHSSKLAGLNENGYGPHLELATGRGAWQFFVDGGVAHVELGPEDKYAEGGRWRAGIGARWIPRSFEFDKALLIELALEAFTGMQRFEWDDGSVLVRPDAGFGIGWQARFRFGSRRLITFRSMARVTFGTVDRDRVATVCRGTCMMPAESSNTGLTAVFGLQW